MTTVSARAAVAPAPFRARHRSDSVVSILFAGGIYALSLITGPLLARALGPEGRGDYAAVIVPLQLVSWLLPLGMPLAATYYVRRFRSRDLVTSAWALSLAVGIPLAGVVWVFAPHLMRGHDPATIPWLQLAMVVGLVLAPTGTVLELIRAQEGAGRRYNAFVSLGPLLTSVAITVLAVTGRLTVRSALASTVTLTLVWALIVIVRRRGWPRLPLRAEAFRAQTRYGLRAAVGDVSAMTVARLDQLLMVTMVSAFDLGIYAVAVTAATVSMPIVNALSSALFPHLIHTEGSDRTKRMRDGVRWADSASIALTLAIALSAPVVIPGLFGPDFRDAVVIVWLLLPGQLLLNAAVIRMSLLKAEGRPGSASFACGLAAVVTVVMLIPMVRTFGIRGGAITTTVSQTVQFVVVLLMMRRLRRTTTVT